MLRLLSSSGGRLHLNVRSAPFLSRYFKSSQSTSASYKVLCSDPIESVCTDILKERGIECVIKTKLTKQQLLAEIGEYAGLVVRSGTQVTKDVIEAAHKMKVIGRAGVGVDNIDVEAATQKGIIVMNTPGGNTISAAELTMSLIFSLSRNIPAACTSLKEGRWDRKKFTGVELHGKTIGIVGMGRIGREVARWCQGFGMTTIGFDPVLSAEVARAAGIEPSTLEEIWAKSDFITIHTPLNNETRNLIGAETIAKCKNGVRIINAARGGIIDEAALLAGLQSGKVAGAALDVYDQEPPTDATLAILKHPNIICTPHLGASTDEAQLKVAKEIAVQMADALEGKKIVGAVNAPDAAAMTKPEVQPYVRLAGALGNLHAGMMSGKLKNIKITTSGDIVSENNKIIKNAMLKGFLSSILDKDSNVNLINSSHIAQRNGINVELSEASVASEVYKNLLTVQVTTDHETRTIQGVVFGKKQPRVVSIDNYATDFVPEGNFLFYLNLDVPGIVSSVSKVLASSDVNIASFHVGRSKRNDLSIGVIKTDSSIPDDAVSQIRNHKDMFNVRQVNVPGDGAADDDEGVVLATIVNTADGRPIQRPLDPNFGSGPCKKRPGYGLGALRDAPLGRSHRAAIGKDKLRLAIEKSKSILGLPSDYLLGIVPASDTGAFEMAMWSMLGPRPVDVCHWESFGKGWHGDITKELKLQAREFTAPYGSLPDLTQTSPDHDIVFTWNGTTSGVRVPNGNWISSERQGLTFCDATSAAFAMDLPWDKLDVTTYSWQKVLGGEGAHGVLILGPRAVERLESYKPSWPMPKIFRLTKSGKLQKDIFEGNVINTPSMLCVEDYLDALTWAEQIGGLSETVNRTNRNMDVLERFVNNNNWIHFLAKDPSVRSPTSVCLTVDLPNDKLKKMIKLLDEEGVCYDIGGYRDAPPGIRIWCGATVEDKDLEKMLSWLNWAYTRVKN